MMSNVLKESSRGIDIIPIDDHLLANNNVFITGAICRESCNEVIKKLIYLNSLHDDNEITIFIDSGGGEVQAGLALYDFIRMLQKPVRTVILGQACSIAAVLFLAADTRLLLSDSRVMIHDPSFAGGHDVSGLKSHEIQVELDELNKCREKIASIIAERTEKSIEEVYEVTKKDSFFNATESIEFGLSTGLFSLNEKR